MSRINLINTVAQEPAKPRTESAHSPASPESPAKGAALRAPSEQVHLSNAAKQLLSAKGAPVDSHKVAKLAAEIKSGTYQVDSQALAKRIIGDVATVARPVVAKKP